MKPVDDRFLKGLHLFEKHEYFECHEVIEDLWLETPIDDNYRDLYKGVIQAAAAIYQKERGIMSGAWGLYKTSIQYLEKYKPEALGLNVDEFIQKLKSHFNELKNPSVFVLTFLLISTSAQAAPYYSLTTHQSEKNYRVLLATRFEDEGSCRDTAEGRRVDLDASWKLIQSDCRDEAEIDAETLKTFNKEVLSEPYLVFFDEQGYANTTRFRNVPPLFIDVMVWKWSEGLKKQGLREMEIVMGPNRQKVANMIEQAAAQVSKEGENPIAFSKTKPLKKNSKAPIQESTPDSAPMSEVLILKNGYTLEGKVLKEGPDGVLFRAGEGTDTFFSKAEIKELRKTKKEV